MGIQVIARISTILAAALVLAGMNSAHAQAYPAKTVHVIVGNAAGSGNDLIARLYCQRLSDSLGRVVVELLQFLHHARSNFRIEN